MQCCFTSSVVADVNVAVVIPTLNRADLLADCLEAVDETCDPVIVQPVKDMERRGFAATCNRGATEVDESIDLLCFLNDDTIPKPGWLDAMLAVHEPGRIVGAHLVYPDGTTQHSSVHFRRHATGELEAYNEQDPDRESGPVPAVTGACMLVDRERFLAAGGFDGAFRNGYEDVDLCLRWHEQEIGPIWYAADAEVVHLEGQSEGRFRDARKNIRLLQRRWGIYQSLGRPRGTG